MDTEDARRIEQFVNSKINPLQAALEITAKSAEHSRQKIELEELEKNRNALVEINSRTFDKAQTYTTVIIAGAYAAIFALWSKSEGVLSHKASTIIIVCLTISVIFFVLYEIFGIGLRAFHLIRFRQEVRAAKTPAQYADYLSKLNTREARVGLNFAPLYVISLLVTLLPAMVSAVLIIYNNMADLLTLPRWPK